MQICFPWQQEQPDSIHLGSEKLRRGTEQTTQVRHLFLIGNRPVCRDFSQILGDDGGMNVFNSVYLIVFK